MEARPTIGIFSDSNFFSLFLVETLLSKIFKVIVFAPDPNLWQERAKHITNRTNLEILDERSFNQIDKPNYVIFCLGFKSKVDALDKFKRIYLNPYFRGVKSLGIFPFEIYDEKENSRLPLNSDLAVLYLGDLLGPRIDLESDLLISRLISEVVKDRSMTLPVGEVFYPLFVGDASKQISKWILSFGPYGKETFLLGDEVSGAVFWKEVAKVVPGTNLYYDQALLTRALPRGKEIQRVSSNLAFSLKETFAWVSKFKPQVSSFKKGVKAQVKKVRRSVPGPKYLKPTLLAVIIILLTPVLSLLLSGSMFFAAYRSFLIGNTGLSRNLLTFSKGPSIVTEVTGGILGYIPLIGRVYKEINFTGTLLRKGSDLGVEAIEVSKVSGEFLTSILGNEIYDPTSKSNDLRIGLDRIYKSTSFIEADTKSAAEAGSVVAKKLIARVDLASIKKISSEASKVFESFPTLLGKDSRKSYLVLFQNNMELRPTGGFIGSFGILTFEGGRMTDLSVSDVYSADGQLKGHIEPPKAIRDHLGEANWYLRDSNWDPDFPTSAQRAEWFLDKETDRQVDGVIAIDLSPVKKILEYTGPIYLSDYEKDITSENLYEETQSEVHEEFFPGTHKKASFLTSLSRNLVTNLHELSSSQKAGILKVIAEGFEEKHIQTYLHDAKVQNALSSLNWGGEVRTPSCGERCYSDLVGVVEANVGVNKANYFISRDQDLSVEVLPDRIKRNLKLTIKNSANPSLGLSGKYKAYIRVLISEDAEVDSFSLPSGFEVYDAKGRKEVGFLVETIGGQESVIDLSWSSPRGNASSYGVYVRKQSGVEENGRLSVVINGDILYNSNLIKDTWIQNP